MNFGQGSLGFNTNSSSGPPFPITSADNGVSVAPAGEIVLGNDVGSTEATLFSDRDIPGFFGIAITEGSFGIGFTGNQVGSAVQRLIIQKLFGSDNVQSVIFSQLVSTPAGNALVGTIIDLALQNVYDFQNGFLTSGIGTRCAVVKATNNVTGNDGNKTVPELTSYLAASVLTAAVLLTRLTGITIDGSDNTFGPTGNIDELIGLRIANQNTIPGVVVGRRYAILQEGVNDEVVFFGIPNRSATSSVVVRDNTTNQLKKIAGQGAATFTTVDGKTVTVVDGVITTVV